MIQAFPPISAKTAYADPGKSLQYAIQILEEGPGNDADTQDSLAPQAGPQISIFYGTTQSFGQLGHPQRQINILGNAADPDGINSLTYILNGGHQKTLSLGPDTRRLLKPGDFNVELYDGELIQDANTLVITATDTQNDFTSVTVTVNYDKTHTWPVLYQTNWASSGIQSQAQVVDGKWEVQGGGLRIMEVGYDRLVAIGDVNWKDYEVTVPITINAVDLAGGFAAPSYGPGIGLIMRWTGHTNDPVSGYQPLSGWWPLGAIGWIRWKTQTPTTAKLQIFGNQDADIASTPWTPPTGGETYIFKMRVATTQSGPEYKLKVWSSLVTEPVGWNLSGTGSIGDPAYGSLVLLTHHVDATFGNVHVVPLGLYQNFLPAISH